MKINEDDIQIMAKLGLTSSQARVYCSLLQSGKTTARKISKNLKIARQEVYRVLAELHEKGLIERIITIPTQFQALPAEECINFLIERQKQAIYEVEKQATKLLKKLKENRNSLQEEAQFILLPEKGNYIERTKKLVKKSKISIDKITTSERVNAFTTLLSDELKEALQRKVKIRIIVTKSESRQTHLIAPKTLRKNPLFNLKLTNRLSDIILLIIDGQEANIVTSEKQDIDESITLWTNNKPLIEILQAYFETLWANKES